MIKDLVWYPKTQQGLDLNPNPDNTNSTTCLGHATTLEKMFNNSAKGTLCRRQFNVAYPAVTGCV